MKKTIIGSMLIAAGTVATSAHAALDAAVVTAVQTEVLADVGTAVAAGFAIMAVVLASAVGMSLLGRFISKGANGG